MQTVAVGAMVKLQRMRSLAVYQSGSSGTILAIRVRVEEKEPSSLVSQYRMVFSKSPSSNDRPPKRGRIEVLAKEKAEHFHKYLVVYSAEDIPVAKKSVTLLAKCIEAVLDQNIMSA